MASALITTNRNYLVTDTDLTVRRMLEFASALKSFDADQVRSYRIESSSQTIQGAEVEIPRIKNDTMRAVLAVFRGEATLAEAPEQELEVVTTTSVATAGSEAPTTTADEPTADDESSASGDDAATATTLPVVEVAENTRGVVPDRSVSCS